MSMPVGGLRARLIRESLFQMINTALDDLGWFNSVPTHDPIAFNAEAIADFEAIPFNTAALADSDITDEDLELGSNLTEERWRFYVDFFAESDALGLHFSRDVRDLLRGKISAIGRTSPDFEVYDYQDATPPVLFYCQIEGVLLDRPEIFRTEAQKHWYSIRFDVVDSYRDENG